MNIPVIAFCDTDSDLQVGGGGVGGGGVGGGVWWWWWRGCGALALPQPPSQPAPLWQCSTVRSLSCHPWRRTGFPQCRRISAGTDSAVVAERRAQWRGGRQAGSTPGRHVVGGRERSAAAGCTVAQQLPRARAPGPGSHEAQQQCTGQLPGISTLSSLCRLMRPSLHLRLSSA